MVRFFSFLGLRVMMWSMWLNFLRNVCYLNKRKIFLKLLFFLKRKEIEYYNMYKGNILILIEYVELNLKIYLF